MENRPFCEADDPRIIVGETGLVEIVFICWCIVRGGGRHVYLCAGYYVNSERRSSFLIGEIWNYPFGTDDG